MEPTQEWPSVTETKLQDSTENYTESQSIRVTRSQPFQVTGIDYAGPLYVCNANKEVSKVYICLFTCTAIRAVHLELVEDQTACAFWRAFKRFASRRGIPEWIISDNVKTFKAGSQDLQALKVLAEEDNLKK